MLGSRIFGVPLIGKQVLLSHVRRGQMLTNTFGAAGLRAAVSVLGTVRHSKLPGFVRVTPAGTRLSKCSCVCRVIGHRTSGVSIPIDLRLSRKGARRSIGRTIHTNFASIVVSNTTFSFRRGVTFARRTISFYGSCNMPIRTRLKTVLNGRSSRIDRTSYGARPRGIGAFIRHANYSVLTISVNGIRNLSSVPQVSVPLLGHVTRIDPIPLIVRNNSNVTPRVLHDFIGCHITGIGVTDSLHGTFVATINGTCIGGRGRTGLTQIVTSTGGTIRRSICDGVLVVGRKRQLNGWVFTKYNIAPCPTCGAAGVRWVTPVHEPCGLARQTAMVAPLSRLSS